jgi:mannose-6-phosphate isomerase-like protein (cupin superfamily)
VKASADELLALLPGKITPQWPDGERFIKALAHGSMTVELYAPRGTDPQAPHDQDELYFPISGSATLRVGSERQVARPGTVHFVAAGVDHRFEDFTADFATWVVFWGPKGGEQQEERGAEAGTAGNAG